MSVLVRGLVGLDLVLLTVCFSTKLLSSFERSRNSFLLVVPGSFLVGGELYGVISLVMSEDNLVDEALCIFHRAISLVDLVRVRFFGVGVSVKEISTLRGRFLDIDLTLTFFFRYKKNC